MSNTATLDRDRTGAASEPRATLRAKDDAAMLKAAANLTRDLNVPKSGVYWADMLGSALLGYSALLGAMLLRPTWLASASGLVAALALLVSASLTLVERLLSRRSRGG